MSGIIPCCVLRVGNGLHVQWIMGWCLCQKGLSSLVEQVLPALFGGPNTAVVALSVDFGCVGFHLGILPTSVASLDRGA